MHIIDISLDLSSDLPVWPGDPKVALERVRKIEEGSNSNVSRLEMRVHTGTHIDAPVHFLPGKAGAEEVPLAILVGPAYVLQINEDCSVIDAKALEKVKIPSGITRLLLKTRNSKLWMESVKDFREDFVGISEDGAGWLVNRGIRLVGIDYLSISPYKKSRPTHEILLINNVTILEGLDLSKVNEGYYSLICLPLKLMGSDGAPARAILIDEV